MYFHVSLRWQNRERVKAAGSKARQGVPRPSAAATSCPPRGRQAGRQPSLPRWELPGNEPEPNEPRTPQTHTCPRPTRVPDPVRPRQCSSHGMRAAPEPTPSHPAGESLLFPRWSTSGKQRFSGLSRICFLCHWPGDPRGLSGSKGDGKGKKIHCRPGLGKTALALHPTAQPRRAQPTTHS